MFVHRELLTQLRVERLPFPSTATLAHTLDWERLTFRSRLGTCALTELFHSAADEEEEPWRIILTNATEKSALRWRHTLASSSSSSLLAALCILHKLSLPFPVTRQPLVRRLASQWRNRPRQHRRPPPRRPRPPLASS
jgi:hypothetical protein